jgi:hypothetical protein
MSPDQMDVVHELRVELAAVEPSPRFAVGVRARIDARRSAAATWVMRAAVAAAAMMVAGASAVRWSEMAMPATESVKTAAVAGANVLPVPVKSVVAPNRTPVVRVARVPIAVPEREEPRLEVMVPPDEAIAIRNLLRAHRAGQGVVPPAVPVAMDADGLLARLPDVALIKIQPLVVAPLGGEGKDK